MALACTGSGPTMAGQEWPAAARWARPAAITWISAATGSRARSVMSSSWNAGHSIAAGTSRRAGTWVNQTHDSMWTAVMPSWVLRNSLMANFASSACANGLRVDGADRPSSQRPCRSRATDRCDLTSTTTIP